MSFRWLTSRDVSIGEAPSPSTEIPSARTTDRRLLTSIGPARRALITSVIVGVVITATVIAQAILLARLLGWAASHGNQGSPAPTVWLLILAIGARIIAGALGEAVASRAGASVTSTLRAQVYDKVIEAGPAWMAQRRTGALVLATTRGLRSLEPYFGRYLPAAVVAALAPPVALIALAIIDWPSALLALVLIALIPVVMIKLGRGAQRESERQWRRLSSLSTRVLELLRGLPTLRALGQVQRGRDELVGASDAVVESIDATLSASLASGAALEFIAGVGVGLVAMLAGLRLLTGSMSLVAALAVILITPEVYLPLRRAGAEFHASSEGRAAAQSLFAVLDELDGATTASGSSPPSVHGIELDEVSIMFPGATNPSLRSFSTSIEPGEHVAVTGESGSGKTTLLMALSGLVLPSSGTLRFAGISVANLDLAMLRSHIAYVPQRPHVFAASLRRNVDLAGLAPSDDAIKAALEMVGLSHLLEEEGLDLELAEAGSSLSGGERQRLGLTRALIKDPEIVLLDEATANLDAETIEQLRRRVGPWLASRTVVEVSHRPGLIDARSRRVHLVNGSVVPS